MSNLIFNGPVSVSIAVFIINDETGQQGKVGISLGDFKYPSKKDIANRIAEFESDELQNMASGSRLMTKRESFDMITIEKTGQSFALPGGEGWDKYE